MNRNIRIALQVAAFGAALLIASSLASYSALMRDGAVAHPGDLDPTFGVGGKVITPVSIVNGDDYGNAVAIQNDGKIVVAGGSRNRVTDSDYAIARYNVDGSLDASFGSGGKVITSIGTGLGSSELINDIAIQGDGKIVVVGSTSDQNAFVTVRYNLDGSLDNSFGVGGKVFTTPTNGMFCTAYAVALQTDGNIVVAGYGHVDSVTSASDDFALVRYSSNGMLDTSFGTDGIVVTHIGDNKQISAYIYELAIQIDGKIVAAGRANNMNGPDFALARYNADGTLDAGFGTGGTVITPAGEICYSIVLQSDGKIVAAGTPKFSLARYNVDGTPDATFGGGGFVTTQIGQLGGGANDVAVQSDGKIVTAGSTAYFFDDSKFAVVRTNADGTPDMSFGIGGTVITTVGVSGVAKAAMVQNDGKIVVAGLSGDGQDANFALVRYDAGGALDMNFGSGGKVITQVAGDENADDYAQAVALQSDGKIVVAGNTYPYPAFALARYNSDGTLDTGFGSGGKVLTRFDRDNASAYAVTIQSDGKIILAGSTNAVYGSYDFALARYNSDGTLDTSFGIGGKVVTAVSDGGDIAHAITIQSDGKIITVGESSGRFALARYNIDGSLDTSFGNGGTVVTYLNGSAYAYAVALQNNGRIVATGYRQTSQSIYDFAMTRYNADGSLDTSFHGDGRFMTPLYYLYQAYAVAIQNDGRIVVAGRHGASGFALARIKTDGALDMTFGIDGEVLTPINQGTVNSISIQSDGKIVAAGSTGNPHYDADFALARYSSAGVLDQGFGSNGIVISPISEREDVANAVALQSDGKIVAVGSNKGLLDSDFALARFEGGTSSVPVSRRAFDFDGDGKADLSVFRPADSVWYIRSSSTNNLIAQSFGLSTDRLVPSDYDGDGRTDIGVFRDGMWYRLNSSDNAFVALQFGQAGDIPVPGDYDGDHKADAAVYRNGTWYIMQSSAGFTTVQFGTSTDKPVAADYDGDGKFDPAVYRDNTWYFLLSASGFTYVQFGIPTDSPVQADYDGDGTADVAVYRNGTWYVRPSSTTIPYFVTIYLGNGFPAIGTPVPADYDGDGKADIATYRDGSWYIRRSTIPGNYVTGEPFGATGDVALPSVYVP